MCDSQEPVVAANKCRKTFQEYREKLLGNMYLAEEKALMVLRLLLEGNSIRSIERITGVEGLPFCIRGQHERGRNPQ